MISLNHYRRVAYRGYAGAAAEGWIVLAGHNGRVEFVSLENREREWDYALEYVNCPEGALFVFNEKRES